MSERGTYRAIHTVLLDSPEFVDMSPDGQLVFFHLKLRLGATGIGVLPGFESVLAEEGASQWDPKGIAKGLRDACSAGFLIRERNVFWIRNALKFEPSRSLTNANHRKEVQKHLAGLPKLSIVNDFADYYELERPFPELGPSVGYPPGHPVGPSVGPRQARKNGRTEERKNGYSTPPPREQAREGQAELLAKVRRLYGWQGSEGTDPVLMKAFPDDPAVRDRCLEIAVARIEAEGKEFQGKFFRKVLRDVASEQIECETGGVDIGDHWQDPEPEPSEEVA